MKAFIWEDKIIGIVSAVCRAVLSIRLIRTNNSLLVTRK